MICRGQNDFSIFTSRLDRAFSTFLRITSFHILPVPFVYMQCSYTLQLVGTIFSMNVSRQPCNIILTHSFSTLKNTLPTISCRLCHWVDVKIFLSYSHVRSFRSKAKLFCHLLAPFVYKMQSVNALFKRVMQITPLFNWMLFPIRFHYLL